jgi:diaminohydroxyphosphoribosylaminopyrimidine deaminase/5-amino-6-(5-phosphoribosylamino)uracil reductase
MDDRERIGLAFDLARGARGSTLPNPAVGAIVWSRDGKRVSEATTSPTGRPHAEKAALGKAGARAEGGCMAVTLEPCVAFPGKKSPPCAAAVILSGLERVVVGCLDPNPQVRGKGVHALRRAGIQVDVLDPEGSIEDFYAGFGTFLATGRPRVTLKIAMSADGMASAADGERSEITGEESRRFVHGLRAASDAILVGGRTVAIDDPRLDVRVIRGPSPRPLVLSGRTELPGHRFLWSNPATTVLGPSRPASLPGKVRFAEVRGRDGRPQLSACLDWCGEQGIHDLMVEPGPGLLDAFLDAGLWDRLWVLRSPARLGRGVPFDPHSRLPRTDPVRTIRLGVDEGALWERVPSPEA